MSSLRHVAATRRPARRLRGGARIGMAVALLAACRDRGAPHPPGSAQGSASAVPPAAQAPAPGGASRPLPPGPRRPAFPRVVRDYCEGETCAKLYGARLLACAELPLRAADSAGAPVVGRAAAGCTVRAATGNVHVLEPGLVVARQPFELAEERWWAHCGDAAAFLGCAGRRELEAQWAAAVPDLRAEAGLEADDEEWAGYLAALDAEGAPTAYVFRCLHCGQLGGYGDTD